MPNPEYERFTDRCRTVMRLANEEAILLNHEYLGTEHILLGLAKERDGVAGNVLNHLKADLEKLRTEVSRIVESGPDMVVGGKLPLTPRAKQISEIALKEAHSLGHNYIGTEHLLLGLLCVPDGVAVQALLNLGISVEDVRKEVFSLLGHDD